MCMPSIQGVQHFRDIRYTDTISYGEMLLQSEYEMSCYNLDRADVDGQWQRFRLFETEAQRMIEARLPVVAVSHRESPLGNLPLLIYLQCSGML